MAIRIDEKKLKEKILLLTLTLIQRKPYWKWPFRWLTYIYQARMYIAIYIRNKAVETSTALGANECDDLLHARNLTATMISTSIWFCRKLLCLAVCIHTHTHTQYFNIYAIVMMSTWLNNKRPQHELKHIFSHAYE